MRLALVQVRLSGKELRLIRSAARKNERPTATWARRVLLEQANKDLTLVQPEQPQAA